MIDNLIKIEILKEVLIKSGFDKDKEVINSMADCVKNDRFLVEFNNDEVIKFVTWEYNKENEIFINNLWIDLKYRNSTSLFLIRDSLRKMFKGYRGFFFDRKKQKLIDRR